MSINATSELSSVSTSQLVDGSVTSSKLDNNAVVAAKIAAGAVGSAALASSSVVAASIAAGAVGSAALASGAVVSAAIASGAVGSAALADNAVVSSKINSGSATSGQILQANGSGGVSFSTPAASGPTWIKIAGALHGTALGLSDGAYQLTNVGSSSLNATISGSARTISAAGFVRISATSSVSSIGENGGTFTTKTAVNATYEIRGLAYGFSLWIVGTTSGVVSTSPDMVTWTNRTSNTGGRNINCIARGADGYLVLGSNSGFFSYSSDGTTWIAGSYSGSNIGTTACIVYSSYHGQWIRGGDTNVSAGSASSQGSPYTVGSNTIQGIAVSDGGLIVVGNNAGAIFTATSVSGTWTSRTSQFSSSGIMGLTYGNGMFVAVGESGKISTSTDGITWTSRTSGFGIDRINAITWADPYFVAVGSSGKVSTSTDGITWTLRGQAIGGTDVWAVSPSQTGSQVGIAGSSGKTGLSPQGLAEVLYTPITYTTKP